MIEVPEGWVAHQGVHLLTMYPPRGGGRIRLYQRMRPLMRASQVIERLLRDDPAFRLVRMGDLVRCLTSEGEHAAWIELGGVRGGGHVHRYLGMVFADEYVAALDALVIDRNIASALQARARELLMSVELGPGTRQRRFVYTPPAGWLSLPRGLSAYYFAPGYPRRQSLIEIPPARPAATADPEAIADNCCRGIPGAAIAGREAHWTASGLGGWRFSIRGRAGAQDRPIWRDMVVLHHAGQLYTVRLDTNEAETGPLSAVLEAIADSIEPIPRSEPRVLAGPLPQVLGRHWVE